MTWHAPRGLTVLTAAEAMMFSWAIESIIEEMRSFDGDEGRQLCHGPEIFNRMTRTQQAASLELVANALFRETSDPFPLVAWSEATLAAILGAIKGLVHIEIDDDEDQSNELRDLIDRLTDSQVTPEKKDWNSRDEWDFTVESYESQFLWDRDFEVDELLDSAPEKSRIVEAMMGVDEDYHTTIPPDLKSDEELIRCLLRVREIIVVEDF